MGLTYIFTWIVYFNFVAAFNIDQKNPYIYKGTKDTYFGYSIAFNNDKEVRSIIVGAPFSNETSQKTWGSVHICNYKKYKKDSKCPLAPNLDAAEHTFGSALKDKQMMGATVYSDNVRTLACAPRYKTKKTGVKKDRIWMVGKCDVFYPPRMRDKWDQYSPCDALVDELEEFGYCQAGISAKLSSRGETTDMSIISGMPRAYLSRGLLSYFGDGATTKFTEESTLNISDYLGYSVGSGKFYTGDTLSMVGGAPRANLLMGRVLLYQITSGPFTRILDISDPSDRPGSYFGSSLAVTNIDNDEKNLDDLVVGAPYYSSGQQPNEGAVYVYLNLKDGLELRQKIYGEKQRNACFGFAIGSVGDLNKDANNDIVIGAPWGGPDGKGVVYVYYGAPSKHEPLILKQTIHPKDIQGGDQLNGFGFSFAEYYPYSAKKGILNDVDNNKYPDIGIGAYRSDSVVILRSRPVVTILGTLALEDNKQEEFKRIDLFDLNKDTMCTFNTDGKKYKCLHVKVSFTITGVGIGSAGTDIKYTIDVDANQKVSKRGFFAEPGTGQKIQAYTDTMNVQNFKRHHTVTVYLVNNTKDIVREMVVKLNWEIQEPASCKISGTICPIANEMVYLLSQKKIAYIKGCSSDGNDVCNTDLQLKLTSIDKKISSGITEVLKIKAVIRNNGENAFLNKLRIVYPLGIQPNKVQIANYPGTVIWDPNVSLDKQNVYTLEVTLSNPINQNKEEIVDIQFGVGSLSSSIKSVTLTGNVVTESEEMKPADNRDTVSVGVVLVANLTISGSVSKEFWRWNKDVTSIKSRGPQIIHMFLLQNRGPSDVEDGFLEIKIPETIKERYILNIVKFDKKRSKPSTNKMSCIVGELDPIKLNDTGVAASRSTATNVTQGARRQRRGVDKQLDCMSGDTEVRCRTITCSSISLKKSGDVSINITSTLVEWTFEKYIKENRKLSVYAKFTSGSVGKPDKNPAPDDIEVSFTVLSPHDTVKADSQPLAWWIILLCVLAALIIILGVVAILYKRGFFKRQRATAEEEKLKNGFDEDEEEE